MTASILHQIGEIAAVIFVFGGAAAMVGTGIHDRLQDEPAMFRRLTGEAIHAARIILKVVMWTAICLSALLVFILLWIYYPGPLLMVTLWFAWVLRETVKDMQKRN